MTHVSPASGAFGDDRWDHLLDHPILAWDDWSMGRTATLELAAWLEQHRPHRILELGSGNTTAFLAQYARRHRAEVVTLEHNRIYCERTRQLLQRLNLLETVEVRHAQLTRQTFSGGRRYYWYNTSLSGTFDFILVDGPPMHYGRQAALFAIAEHLAPRWHLWLDDGNRSHERQCVELWAQYVPFARAFHIPSPRGMWLLSSESPQFAADLPMAFDRLGVSLLAGRRFEQFKQFLQSLQMRVPGLLERSHTLVTLNRPDPQMQTYVDKLPFVNQCFRHSNGVMSSGEATSQAILALADIAWVDCILHLADDWQVVTLQCDWLAQAHRILDADPSVGQVRLRHRSEKVGSYHMITRRPIVWERHGAALVSMDAHYTFQPSLIRAQDAACIFPCIDERDAQRHFLQAGFSVAQLLPGVFNHTDPKPDL